MMLDSGDQAVTGREAIARHASKLAQRIQHETDVAVFRGVGRAHGRATYLVAQDEAAQFVTESAMMGVVRVSMFARMCGQVEPSATDDLQMLMAAYAMGAVRRVTDAGR